MNPTEGKDRDTDCGSSIQPMSVRKCLIAIVRLSFYPSFVVRRLSNALPFVPSTGISHRLVFWVLGRLVTAVLVVVLPTQGLWQVVPEPPAAVLLLFPAHIGLQTLLAVFCRESVVRDVSLVEVFDERVHDCKLLRVV